MKRVIGIALLGISAFWINSAIAEDKKEEKAQLVSVQKVVEERVAPTIWLPGNVVSRRDTPLSAEQTGQLNWILDVGAEVKKGDVIARIDNRHLKLELAQLQASVRELEARVAYFKKQLQRMNALLENNNAAISEIDKMHRDFSVAKEQLQSSRIQVQQVELNIEKTNIKAPFNGSISQRFANIGELITAGRALIQLVDTSSLDISIAAPLSIASYVRNGAKVLVKSDGQLVSLPIRALSPAGVESSRTFEVLLDASGTDLISGSAVSVSLPKKNETLALLVPRDALVLRDQETFVLTVNNENVAKKVSVIVGQGVGDWVSVIGSLEIGDKVVIRGNETLTDGKKVRFDENADRYVGGSVEPIVSDERV